MATALAELLGEAPSIAAMLHIGAAGVLPRGQYSTRFDSCGRRSDTPASIAVCWLTFPLLKNSRKTRLNSSG